MHEKVIEKIGNITADWIIYINLCPSQWKTFHNRFFKKNSSTYLPNWMKIDILYANKIDWVIIFYSGVTYRIIYKSDVEVCFN